MSKKYNSAIIVLSLFAVLFAALFIHAMTATKTGTHNIIINFDTSITNEQRQEITALISSIKDKNQSQDALAPFIKQKLSLYTNLAEIQIQRDTLNNIVIDLISFIPLAKLVEVDELQSFFNIKTESKIKKETTPLQTQKSASNFYLNKTGVSYILKSPTINDLPQASLEYFGDEERNKKTLKNLADFILELNHFLSSSKLTFKLDKILILSNLNILLSLQSKYKSNPNKIIYLTLENFDSIKKIKEFFLAFNKLPKKLKKSNVFDLRYKEGFTLR